MVAYRLVPCKDRSIVAESNRKPYANPTTVPQAYGNGFNRRRPWAVSRELVAVSAPNFATYFKTQHDDLRSLANGGYVTTGFDFKFETLAGVDVPFTIASYDGVSGTVEGFAALPLYGSSTPSRGYLYWNNPEKNVSQENRLGTWPLCHIITHLPSGTDDSGNGRNFPTAFPTSTTQIVGNSANFTADANAQTQDGTFLNNKTELSGLLFWKAAAANTDNVPFAIGVLAGSTPVFMRHDAVGSDGQTNSIRFGYTFDTGTANYETDSNAADASLHHVAFSISSGAEPSLWIDGKLQTWVYKDQATPISGKLVVPSGNLLMLGRGAVAARSWRGLLDEFRLMDRTIGQQWVTTNYNNLTRPNDFMIFGDPETPNTKRSAFSEAINASVKVNEAVTIDAAKYGFDVDGLALSIDSPTTPTSGTVTQPGGTNVKYTNTSNTTIDRFTVRTKNTDGKGTRAPIIVVVDPGTVNPTGPEIPLGMIQDQIADQSAFSQWLSSGNAAAGRMAVLAPGDYRLGTFNKNGNNQSTGGKPIIIAARDMLLDSGKVMNVSFTGDTTIGGDDVWLYGINLGSGYCNFNGNRQKLRRVKWTGFDRLASDGAGLMQSTFRGVDQEVAYFDLSNTAGRGFGFNPNENCLRPFVTMGYVHDFLHNNPNSQTFEGINFGLSNPDSLKTLQGKMSYVYFKDMNQGNDEKEALSNKCSDNTYYRLIFENARSCSNRHGRGNTYIGILVKPGGLSPHIVTRDGTVSKFNRFFGCESPTFEIPNGDIDPETDSDWPGPKLYPISKYAQFISCKATTNYNVGAQPSNPHAGRSMVKANFTTIEGSRGGTVNKIAGREQNTTVKALQSGRPTIELIQPELFTPTSVGPLAPWKGLPQPPDVG